MKRYYCVTKQLDSGRRAIVLGEDDEPLFFEQKEKAKTHRNALEAKEKPRELPAFGDYIGKLSESEQRNARLKWDNMSPEEREQWRKARVVPIYCVSRGPGHPKNYEVK